MTRKQNLYVCKMSLFVTALNSGSNGNCYYVGNEHEAILVDAGISCREIERRMDRLGLSLHQVKGIFISHEHSDHIKGLCRLSDKYQLPVHISRATLMATGYTLPPERVSLFQAGAAIPIGGLSVIPFMKKHDAADPYSFVISGNGVNIGVFTDIGYACERVIDHFQQCHAVFLETNYDEEMLKNGRYPYFLKARISSNHGHLSNQQALNLFLSHRHERLSHLFPSHLSRDNNKPELVAQLFAEHAGNTEIILTSREQETAVYQINP